MKAKKLWALLICLMTAFVLFSFQASAEGDCGHAEEFRQWIATPNSCTSEGKYELVCNYVTDAQNGTVCGHIYGTEVIPAHNYSVVFVSKTATCTEEGVEVVYCSWCNKVDNRIAPKNPANHKFSGWSYAKAEDEPTCITEGKQTRACTRDNCGYTETKAVPADSSKHIEKPDSEWKVIKEATCYVEGVEENTCKVCNKVFTRAIPVHSDYAAMANDNDRENGYNITEYIRSDVKEANCSQEASAKYTCRDCGTAFTVKGAKDYDKHDFTDESKWTYTEGANCAHPGKFIKQCKHNSRHTVEEVYAPHIYEGYEYITAEPGCGAEGFIPGSKEVKCLYCDEFETRVIDEEKHSFGDWAYADGSSCATGGKAVRSCNCGAVTEEKAFGAWDHPNYTVTFTSFPTCDKKGYQEVICDDCDTKFYVFPEGLNSRGGHTPGEWVVTKAATCTESGEREHHCYICDEVYEKEVIPQRVHTNITLKEGYDATCTESGITPYFYCSACANVFEQEVIPALKHSFVEQYTPGEGAVRICERCFEYEIIADDDTPVTCSCLCHNSNGLAKIVWKIVTFFFKLFGMNQQCKCGIVHY